jgi:hypothetical protein
MLGNANNFPRQQTPAIGINVEEYTTCVRSEYHIEHRPVQVDTGTGKSSVTVEFSFIVTAANVVVAKKNNDLSAYGWITKHSKGR